MTKKKTKRAGKVLTGEEAEALTDISNAYEDLLDAVTRAQKLDISLAEINKAVEENDN